MGPPPGRHLLPRGCLLSSRYDDLRCYKLRNTGNLGVHVLKKLEEIKENQKRVRVGVSKGDAHLG
jgi:hypothetical protein